MTGKARREYLLEVINTEGLSLDKKLPNGFYPRMAAELKTTTRHIGNALNCIRERSDTRVQKSKKIAPVSLIHELVQYSIKHDFQRGSPHKEKKVCHTIEKLLWGMTPGGYGLVIGTPSPFSFNLRYAEKLFLENYDVAHAMERTTDVTKIVVGSGVNPAKAEEKLKLWKLVTDKSEVIIDIVDILTYYRHVSNLAESGKPTKVVLLTNGTWKSKSKRYGLHVDFGYPSDRLVEKYPNLCIMALISDDHYNIKPVIMGNQLQQ